MLTLDEFADYIGVDADDLSEERVRRQAREAVALIRAEVDLPDEVGSWPEAAYIVLLRVMARAYEVSDAPVGVSQVSYSAGPFSRNVSYRADASAGGLWLTKADKRLLGVGGQTAYSVDLMPQPRVAPRPDWWWPVERL